MKIVFDTNVLISTFESPQGFWEKAIKEDEKRRTPYIKD